MKLKKSLLIVPAMATLLFAAAGSVGGTVAWFSARTSFNTDISSFKVVRLDGNLDCAMAAGVGTTYDSVNSKIVVPHEGNTRSELTHGSFNHGNKNVYVIAGSGFAKKATVSEAGTVSDGSLAATTYTSTETISSVATTVTHNVYYAVTWTMDFTYTLPVSADTAQATNLYLDLANSRFDGAHGSGSYGKHTELGFRIAFIPNTASSVTTSGNSEHHTRVWADLQTSTNCTYVPASGTTPATYGTDDLISNDDRNTVIAEGQNGSKSLNYCLGQFSAFTGGQSKLGFSCVAWYEGTDENVINESTLDEVTVNLAFYTRTSSN